MNELEYYNNEDPDDRHFAPSTSTKAASHIRVVSTAARLHHRLRALFINTVYDLLNGHAEGARSPISAPEHKTTRFSNYSSKHPNRKKWEDAASLG